MIEKNGRLYHPITPVVRKMNWSNKNEHGCESLSPVNDEGNDWICERQSGHLGAHMAWENSNTGLLYLGGMWE